MYRCRCRIGQGGGTQQLAQQLCSHRWLHTSTAAVLRQNCVEAAPWTGLPGAL